MTVGFVALWKNTQREFRASPREERGTTLAIQDAFARGRERGTQSYGLFSCRFGSGWQYFTFWTAPSLAAVFETIADLERAGDFKFAQSRHAFGTLASGEPDPNTNWSVIPEPAGDGPPIVGLITFSRSRSGTTLVGDLTHPGANWRSYGAFDCRFSSGWDQFCFATAPDPAVLQHASSLADAPNTHTERFIGSLDRFYRFGAHLQRDLSWLDGEAPE